MVIGYMGNQKFNMNRRFLIYTFKWAIGSIKITNEMKEERGYGKSV